jgi:hypothetical protein
LRTGLTIRSQSSARTCGSAFRRRQRQPSG